MSTSMSRVTRKERKYPHGYEQGPRVGDERNRFLLGPIGLRIAGKARLKKPAISLKSASRTDVFIRSTWYQRMYDTRNCGPSPIATTTNKSLSRRFLL